MKTLALTQLVSLGNTPNALQVSSFKKRSTNISVAENLLTSIACLDASLAQQAHEIRDTAREKLLAQIPAHKPTNSLGKSMQQCALLTVTCISTLAISFLAMQSAQ